MRRCVPTRASRTGRSGGTTPSSSPDVVVVLEPSLVHEADVAEGVGPATLVLLNAEEPPPGSRRHACCCVPRRPAGRRERSAVRERRDGRGGRRGARRRRRSRRSRTQACDLLGRQVRPAGDRGGGSRRATHGCAEGLAAARSRAAPSSAPRSRASEPAGGARGSSPRPTSPAASNCLLCWLYCPDSAVVLDGHDVRRLRPRRLQGLRDLRRDVPDGRDRDGARWR